MGLFSFCSARHLSSDDEYFPPFPLSLYLTPKKITLETPLRAFLAAKKRNEKKRKWQTIGKRESELVFSTGVKELFSLKGRALHGS